MLFSANLFFFPHSYDTTCAVPNDPYHKISISRRNMWSDRITPPFSYCFWSHSLSELIFFCRFIFLLCVRLCRLIQSRTGWLAGWLTGYSCLFTDNNTQRTVYFNSFSFVHMHRIAIGWQAIEKIKTIAGVEIIKIQCKRRERSADIDEAETAYIQISINSFICCRCCCRL